MNTRRKTAALALNAMLCAFALLTEPAPAHGQDATATDSAAADTSGGRRRPRLFDVSTPISFAVVADFRQIRRDRGEDSPYRPARIEYDTGGGQVSLPVAVRTRGIWRRRNCEIPPLRLNFARDSVRGTAFAGQNHVRLVIHCRNNDQYEQLVLREFQLYRVQNLLTRFALRARLARVHYVNAANRDTIATRYAFLLEDDHELAERLGGEITQQKGAQARDLDPGENAFFGAWEFFVGNTDFSVSGLHNVALVATEGTYYPLAHDYDFSGAVEAPYAIRDPRLPPGTVRQRLMRGYCSAPEEYERAFARFRAQKDSIYALYSDSVAAPLSRGNAQRALRYFDEFYETIGDARRARREISEACIRTG